MLEHLACQLVEQAGVAVIVHLIAGKQVANQIVLLASLLAVLLVPLDAGALIVLQMMQAHFLAHWLEANLLQPL
ncbi:hypothetical protein D3C85_1708060 [compost metagenome]